MKRDKIFLGSGISFPFKINNNGEIEMSSLEKSIEESIFIILSTKLDERIMNPSFGCQINELVFSKNSSEIHNLASYYIKDALYKWEHRIIIENVEAKKKNYNTMNIELSYIIRSTNSSQNLVYPFYLEEQFDLDN